jgi:hypothetical protein
MIGYTFSYCNPNMNGGGVIFFSNSSGTTVDLICIIN